jgi:hypothetical protein
MGAQLSTIKATDALEAENAALRETTESLRKSNTNAIESVVRLEKEISIQKERIRVLKLAEEEKNKNGVLCTATKKTLRKVQAQNFELLGEIKALNEKHVAKLKKIKEDNEAAVLECKANVKKANSRKSLDAEISVITKKYEADVNSLKKKLKLNEKKRVSEAKKLKNALKLNEKNEEEILDQKHKMKMKSSRIIELTKENEGNEKKHREQVVRLRAEMRAEIKENDKNAMTAINKVVKDTGALLKLSRDKCMNKIKKLEKEKTDAIGKLNAVHSATKEEASKKLASVEKLLKDSVARVKALESDVKTVEKTAGNLTSNHTRQMASVKKLEDTQEITRVINVGDIKGTHKAYQLDGAILTVRFKADIHPIGGKGYIYIETAKNKKKEFTFWGNGDLSITLDGVAYPHLRNASAVQRVLGSPDIPLTATFTDPAQNSWQLKFGPMPHSDRFSKIQVAITEGGTAWRGLRDVEILTVG